MRYRRSSVQRSTAVYRARCVRSTKELTSQRIVVGGFSQGAAVTYLSVLTSERKLGGAITLSGYLPLRKKITSMRTDASKKTPWFAGHGEADQVVPVRATCFMS